MFLKLTLIGHLGRDPETRVTPSGETVANFSVATTKKKKDASGNVSEKTLWFNCACWRKQAELASKYLKKGHKVYLEGEFVFREYTDKDGQAKSSLDLIVDQMIFLESKPQDVVVDAVPSAMQMPSYANDELIEF